MLIYWIFLQIPPEGGIWSTPAWVEGYLWACQPWRLPRTKSEPTLDCRGLQENGCKNGTETWQPGKFLESETFGKKVLANMQTVNVQICAGWSSEQQRPWSVCMDVLADLDHWCLQLQTFCISGLISRNQIRGLVKEENNDNSKIIFCSSP